MRIVSNKTVGLEEIERAVAEYSINKKDFFFSNGRVLRTGQLSKFDENFIFCQENNVQDFNLYIRSSLD